LSNIAANLTPFVLKNFESIKPLKQKEVLVSYSPKIKKEDGLISFEDNANNIYKKFKAFYFWPTIFLKSGLKLKKIDIVEKDSLNIPAKILKINQNSIIVGCTKGSVEIFEVQPPSKKVINARDYLRGKRLGLGDLFE